jgi:hypothetical protein
MPQNKVDIAFTLLDTIVTKFLNEVKLAKLTHIHDGQKLVCGGIVVFSCDPDLETPTRYRIEMPILEAVDVGKHAYLHIFVNVIFGTAALLQLRPHLMALLLSAKGFQAETEDFRLIGRTTEDSYILEAMPCNPHQST